MGIPCSLSHAFQALTLDSKASKSMAVTSG